MNTANHLSPISEILLYHFHLASFIHELLYNVPTQHNKKIKLKYLVAWSTFEGWVDQIRTLTLCSQIHKIVSI